MMPGETFTPQPAVTSMLRMLQIGMQETMQKLESVRNGTPDREVAYRFGTALVRVLEVTADWNVKKNPLRIISVDEACDDILNAMEAALRTIPGSAVHPADREEGLDDLRAP